jgi:hypothetical protein
MKKIAVLLIVLMLVSVGFLSGCSTTETTNDVSNKDNTNDDSNKNNTIGSLDNNLVGSWRLLSSSDSNLVWAYFMTLFSNGTAKYTNNGDPFLIQKEGTWTTVQNHIGFTIDDIKNETYTYRLEKRLKNDKLILDNIDVHVEYTRWN